MAGKIFEGRAPSKRGRSLRLAKPADAQRYRRAAYPRGRAGEKREVVRAPVLVRGGGADALGDGGDERRSAIGPPLEMLRSAQGWPVSHDAQLPHGVGPQGGDVEND